MFHYTNFGSYGEQLERFADLDGYVPEDGDEFAKFNYPSGWFNDDATSAEEEWEAFVSEAVIATGEAEKAIAGWRAS